MYLAYALAYVRARLIRDQAFEMDLPTWKQVHKAKDEVQMQGSCEAGKGSRDAGKHGSMGRMNLGAFFPTDENT